MSQAAISLWSVVSSSQLADGAPSLPFLSTLLAPLNYPALQSRGSKVLPPLSIVTEIPWNSRGKIGFPTSCQSVRGQQRQANGRGCKINPALSLAKDREEKFWESLTPTFKTLSSLPDIIYDWVLFHSTIRQQTQIRQFGMDVTKTFNCRLTMY